MKQTNTLKRLNAVMKDIDGDNTQVLRSMQDQIDYLREKVEILEEVLEEKTGKSQPEFSEQQKKRLAQRGRKLNEYLLSVVEPTFAPGTVHGWYRELIAEKYDSTGDGQKKRGRKPISPEIVEKVLFFQERNPDWGYDRIAGTMKYLGYDVSASTVRKILNDRGIVPDPERRKRGDWQQFIETQQYVTAATDFATVERVTEHGLVREHLLFFMDIGSREVRLGGIVLGISILSFALFATDRQTYRDAQGRTAGTASTSGNRTTYRDAQGRTAGTATTNGNTTVYRDAQGRTVGTATVSGNTTTYRDAQGRTQATARRSGNTTTYRDARPFLRCFEPC